jgi:sortase A
MKKIGIALVSIGIIIIGLYYIIPELQYQHIDSANKIVIPSIGVNESINTKGVDYGVYQNQNVIFGHRTTHGAPFFKLDSLQVGNDVFINGKHYIVANTQVVPENYTLYVDNNVYLVTCTPIGSTSHRILITLEEI